MDRIDPSDTYLFLAPDGRAQPLPGGEAFWSQPPEALDALGRGWLVTEFTCAADWAQWERHPEGDELVYLLEGDAVFVLALETGTVRVPLRGRGAVRVPRGVWHTAEVAAPSRLLFVTWGEGTEHRPAGGAAPR